MLSGSVYESGGRTVTRTLKRTVWPADALVGVRPLFDLKDGSDARARAGFEVMRSNANGDLLAGEHLKVTLVREYRDYRWTYDNESGWHFDYTDRYENSEDARHRSRRRRDAEVRRAGRLGQLPHRDLRSRDRPHDEAAVLRRLELERREPRQGSAAGQGQARARQADAIASATR